MSFIIENWIEFLTLIVIISVFSVYVFALIHYSDRKARQHSKLIYKRKRRHSQAEMEGIIDYFHEPH